MATEKKTAAPTETATQVAEIQKAEPVAHPVPGQGGSYMLDDATGALTLIECTTNNPGRAAQAKPKTKE